MRQKIDEIDRAEATHNCSYDAHARTHKHKHVDCNNSITHYEEPKAATKGIFSVADQQPEVKTFLLADLSALLEASGTACLIKIACKQFCRVSLPLTHSHTHKCLNLYHFALFIIMLL